MQLDDAIFGRRMVRRFDPDRPVPRTALDNIARSAVRAPSAGFSQGWDFVILEGAARESFWTATAEPDGADTWLRGVMSAPTLILCVSDKNRYLDRYAEPDKPWPDRSESHWPVPYWDVDTGMASMLMLLTAVQEGLGGLFFGVAVERHDAVREVFGIPDEHNIVGVIALGYARSTKASGSTRSVSRRPLEDVFHEGAFGRPYAVQPAATSD